MGLQGKGAVELKAWAETCSPFPCIVDVEASDTLMGNDVCQGEHGSMKVQMHCVGEGRRCVEMVADEVFCWLPTMTANRGVPLLRVLSPNT
jgi:hypothetical protein